MRGGPWAHPVINRASLSDSSGLSQDEAKLEFIAFVQKTWVTYGSTFFQVEVCAIVISTIISLPASTELDIAHGMQAVSQDEADEKEHVQSVVLAVNERAVFVLDQTTKVA